MKPPDVATGVRHHAIVLLDPAGRVVGWNVGAERIKGYASEEIMGRSFAVFYPPEEIELGEPARHLAEAAAAGTIVTLAAGLNLKTIAEGVETREQLAAVTALGGDIGQGFLLGRPASREAVGKSSSKR